MAGGKTSDTEITLGMSKLLGLFFALVILCGISLGVGYMIGRNSTKQSVPAALAASTTPATPSPLSVAKPGASQLASPKTQDCPTGDNCSTHAASVPDPKNLTFYNTVQQSKAEHPQLAQPEPAPNSSAQHVQTSPTLGAGFLVQIAAVRNQDDARLLSDALHKQQYPVIIAQPGDNLYHVQVGPYADIKEAEAIRSRLVSAGYNAFLKR